jgi:hypothetical protein
MAFWEVIEEVITALTRNQVVPQGARGFESHTSRQKSPKYQGFRAFLFVLLLKSDSKLWKGQ